MAEGMLRPFGTSPATLFERMGQVAAIGTRHRPVHRDGTEVGRDDHLATVTAPTFRCVFVAAGRRNGAIFTLHVSQVSRPKSAPQAPRNCATITVRW